MFSNGGNDFMMPVMPAYSNGNNGGMGGWGDGWWAIIIFAMIFGWGNGGWGGGFGGNNAGLQGALTRGDLCQDMSFNNLDAAVRGVQSGLCDGFYAVNTSLLNGFHGVDNAICTLGYQTQQGFNNVGSAIAQLGYQNQQCCCETNRNIDAVRYENARSTCDIVNAIREDGALTRAQLTQNEIQGLRDQLQTANFQLSQQAQSASLINQLRPCPIPAYLSCSPYTSYEPYAYNNGYCNRCACNG